MYVRSKSTPFRNDQSPALVHFVETAIGCGGLHVLIAWVGVYAYIMGYVGEKALLFALFIVGYFFLSYILDRM